MVSYLPASNAQKEAQDIGLLLLLKLFHVLEYVSRMTDPTTMGLGSHLERTHIDLAGGLVEWVVVVVVLWASKIRKVCGFPRTQGAKSKRVEVPALQPSKQSSPQSSVG